MSVIYMCSYVNIILSYIQLCDFYKAMWLYVFYIFMHFYIAMCLYVFYTLYNCVTMYNLLSHHHLYASHQMCYQIWKYPSLL